MQTFSLPHAQVDVLADPAALAESCAEAFIQHAGQAIAARGKFVVALAGGSTPKATFALLAKMPGRVDWKKVHVYFGDERHVPPDHADSNFRTAHETLLSRVPIPSTQIFRVLAELPAAEAAADYDAKVRAAGRFDLIMLGMGPDGHTASLFPETTALGCTDKLVVENWVPKFNTFRLTFTYTAINAARSVLFAAAGGDKAEMLRTILRDGADFPSGHVRPADGVLCWKLDAAAASKMGF